MSQINITARSPNATRMSHDCIMDSGRINRNHWFGPVSIFLIMRNITLCEELHKYINTRKKYCKLALNYGHFSYVIKHDKCIYIIKHIYQHITNNIRSSILELHCQNTLNE